MGGRATDNTVITVFQLPVRDDRSILYVAFGVGAPIASPVLVSRFRLTFMSTVSVFQMSAGRRLAAHQPATAASATGVPSKPGAIPSISAASTTATTEARCQRVGHPREWRRAWRARQRKR